MSEYAERDIIEQGDYYSRHTSAMTVEGLHSKSDIAAELAHRDIQIDALRARVAELESAVEALRTAGNRVISYGEPLTEWTVAVQEALYPGSTQRLRQQADEGEKAGGK